MLNPRVDFVFTKLFGSDENKSILISLINSIVFPEDKVQDIVLQNPYIGPHFMGDKMSILDVKAKDMQGNWFNIEMQLSDPGYYKQRALYYWARIYSGQLSQGIRYDTLTKTIVISLLDFNLFPGDDYHNVYRIQNLKTQEEYLPHLELHFIELVKADHPIRPHMPILERWLHFLTRAYQLERKNIPQELLEIEPIEHALYKLEHISLTPEEREVYESRAKWTHDHQTSLQVSLEKGLAEGKIEGKLEIAKNMLTQGCSVELIASVTGLSPQQIVELKQK